MRTSKFRVLHYADEYGPERWEYITLPEDIMGESWKDQHAYNWETWSEYTGFADKNRKEIYESDIVMRDNNLAPHIIAWDEDGADYWTMHRDGGGIDGIDHEHMEVIGNIYEHPRLLRSKP